ncbi:Hypothetical chloroplast protein Ycf34 [Seminavis robusta]|uniref:Hypothetical chloroplast protein Ycf34 n=1 Tax=Seminavis robusta TaxID=568900 RepID=A0A9N8ER88_9STRA|nr:Hypothetical chloroplast protein Ycf34 [Seminavis robusta]|eukprot:Sro1487_g276750.1 Hypothetical chloroplast protein Ycf34 (177) ;mRNA; f:11258-11943
MSTRTFVVSALVGTCSLFTNAFVFPRAMPQKTTTNLDMCICIDCARVTNCQAYHFVESKHNQPHISKSPTFMPQQGSPTIHVNVRTIRTQEDRQKEMERMWSEHETETANAMAKAEQQQDNDNSEPLVGETKYDLSPTTTTEYDVVKCADYQHDQDCWIRNMPQEIKDANPQFVPS